MHVTNDTQDVLVYMDFALSIVLFCTISIPFFSDILRMWRSFERWVTSKESLVLNDDLGASVPAVEELLKNHTNLSNSLLAYEGTGNKIGGNV